MKKSFMNSEFDVATAAPTLRETARTSATTTTTMATRTMQTTTLLTRRPRAPTSAGMQEKS